MLFQIFELSLSYSMLAFTFVTLLDVKRALAGAKLLMRFGAAIVEKYKALSEEDQDASSILGHLVRMQAPHEGARLADVVGMSHGVFIYLFASMTLPVPFPIFHSLLSFINPLYHNHSRFVDCRSRDYFQSNMLGDGRVGASPWCTPKRWPLLNCLHVRKFPILNIYLLSSSYSATRARPGLSRPFGHLRRAEIHEGLTTLSLRKTIWCTHYYTTSPTLTNKIYSYLALTNLMAYCFRLIWSIWVALSMRRCALTLLLPGES